MGNCLYFSSKRKYEAKQIMMAKYVGVCQTTQPIESIQSYIKSELSCSKNYKSNQIQIEMLADWIHEAKLKGESIAQLIDQLEILIEQLEDIPSIKRIQIRSVINNVQVDSKDITSYESIIKVLEKSKKQLNFEDKFLGKYSAVKCLNPFDEVSQKVDQNQLKDLQKSIEQFKWRDVFSNLTDVEFSILNEIKFLLPIYPFLKQWIYLRKSLNQLITKVQIALRKDFPLIDSLTFQDIIILLYFIIPLVELQQIGDCLISNYTPLPLLIKSISDDDDSYLLFDELLFHHTIQAKKSIITYLNTQMVKQDESCSFLQRILCQDPQNGFNYTQKSLKLEKSIQAVAKISHKEGFNKLFIRINDYNSQQNYNAQRYIRVLEKILSQSESVMIHTSYSQLMTIGSRNQVNANELESLIELANKYKQKIKVIFVTEKMPKKEEMENIKSRVYNILNHNSIYFIETNSSILQVWQIINQLENSNKVKCIQQIFQELGEIAMPNNNLKQLEQISNQNEIEQIIESIETNEILLLQLNNLEKEIIDLRIKKQKMKININQQLNENDIEQLDIQILERQNQLSQTKINGNVMKMLDSVVSRQKDCLIVDQKDSLIIDQNKVLQLKMIISQIRGKYYEQYQQKYIEISKKISDKSLSIQKNSLKSNQPNTQQNQELLDFQEELLRIDTQHNKKEITFDMIVNEFNIAMEKAEEKPIHYKQTLEQLFLHNYNTGKPMQIIEGNTLQFGNAFLKGIFNQIKDQNLFVVSIIGLQSSAKSTLLNYLFQVDFAVGNGRVTKGLYFTRILFEDKPIIVIDTEGLMSLVGRDHQYDNSIMAFIFLISNVVIFNQKGEANQLVKELLELCGKVIQQLLKNKLPPSVIFALRDQNDVDSNDNIQKQVLQIANSISDKSVNNSMEIKTENLILFPPAFNEQQIEELSYRQGNFIFSTQVLKLRCMISELMKKQIRGRFSSFEDFYNNSSNMWKIINGNCSDLIIARNLREYQEKIDLQVECQQFIRVTLQSIQLQFQQFKSIQMIFKSDNSSIQIEKDSKYQILENELKQLFQQKNDDLESKLQRICDNQKISDDKIIEMQRKIIKSELDRQQCIEKQKFSNELKDSYTDHLRMQALNEIEQKALKILKENNNKDYQNLLDTVTSKLQKILNTLKKTNEDELEENKISQKFRIEKEWRNIFQELQKDKHLQQNKPILFNFYNSFFVHANQEFQSKEEFFQGKKIFGTKQIEFDRIKSLFDTFSEQEIINYKKDLITTIFDQDQVTEKNILTQLVNYLHQQVQSIQMKQQLKINSSYINCMAKIIIQCVHELQKSVLEGVIKQMKEKMENSIKCRQQKVNKTIETIKGIIQNAGDITQQGKQFMIVNLKPAIVENFFKKMQSELTITIQKLIGNNIGTPSEENKLAFSECWDGKLLNTDNLIKFYLNSPYFIKEMIFKRIALQKIKEYQNQQTKMNEKFTELKYSLQTKLKNMKNDIQDHKDGDFQKYIKSQLSQFTDDFPNLILFMNSEFDLVKKQAFVSGMFQGFNESKELETKDKFQNQIDSIFHNVFQKYVIDAIGCCQTCPFCGAKCILANNHEGTHDVNDSHRFQAYSGVKNRKTRVFSAEDCYYSFTQKWHRGDEEYPNIIALAEKYYPTWVDHFKHAQNEKLSLQFDSNFQKMAYCLIGNWFGAYNNKFISKKKNNQGIVEIPKGWYEILKKYPQIKQDPVDTNLKFDGYCKE